MTDICSVLKSCRPLQQMISHCLAQYGSPACPSLSVKLEMCRHACHLDLSGRICCQDCGPQSGVLDNEQDAMPAIQLCSRYCIFSTALQVRGYLAGMGSGGRRIRDGAGFGGVQPELKRDLRLSCHLVDNYATFCTPQARPLW